jgi:hypothetical protein
MANFRQDGKNILSKVFTSINNASSQAKEEYRQRYNVFSALEVHTVGKIQHLLTLCTLQLKVAEQLFTFLSC